jgi:hypothetical protein
MKMKSRWPPCEEMLSGLTIPDGIRVEQLARDQIEELIARLQEWYPDIIVGSESRHLDRSFYERHCALRGEDQDRPIYCLISRATSGSGEIVSLMSLEKDVLGRQISSPMGAVEPSKRGLGIGQFGGIILEHVGRAIGAEVAFYQATLKTVRQQKNAERHGYRLCGILPAIDRDAVAPGVVKRVYEGVFVKILVPSTEVQIPAWNELGEPARTLWLAIFGEHPER